MEKRIKLIIVFCILFVIPFNINAQKKDKKIKLTQIIAQIQKQYDIQFNYDEDLIRGISINAPKENLPINDVLHYLETSTGFEFTLMTDKMVLVKQRKTLILCGYIKDELSSKSLSSATIQSQKHLVTSNDIGYFELKLNTENDIIEIRHLGYKPIRKTYKELKKTGCSSIYLQSNYNALSEIVISNYITKGIDKLKNGSFELNFSKFEILPGLIDNDVLQSVQAFPGIISINETVSNINIRGGTHDQNLILWDDIKMYQSGHFFGLISMFNPEITHKVSLRKNGSDVTFSDGVSGTIAMHTNKNVTRKFKGNIGVNLTDINGFVDMSIGKNSSIQVAARKSINEFFETPTYTEFFNRISQGTEVENNVVNIINSDKQFDFNDASLRWIYNISENDQLRLSFITVSNELIFNENAVINSIEESRESNITQNSIAESIAYTRVWSDRFETTLEAYETDYKLKAINVNILDSQRFLQENSVSETSAKLKMKYQINDNISLLGGYHFVETGITNLDDIDTPVYRLLISEVIRDHGIFSGIIYNSSKTNLNLGLRYNYIDKFNKIILEPRLSFNQQFLEDFTFEILGEFKHQTTSQVINFQNDFLGVEKRRWQLSNNADIPVITSKQLSVGISYDKSGWLVSAESYFKNVEGITTQSQGFQNQYEFVKTNGSYEIIGLDFLIKKQIHKFNTWMSYSFMNNKYTFDSLETNDFPSNYDITHAITIGTSYSNKSLKISSGLNWHSGKPTTQPVLNNEILNNAVNFEAPNESRLKDYLRLDVSALYYFNLSKNTVANIGVSVWNVLDRDNEINNFYRINNASAEETKQRSLGITPNLLFKVRF
jgi:hypothetical protein